MWRNRMCAFGLAFAVAAHAEVFSWRDAQGRLQYGDHPPDGASGRPVAVSQPARLTPAGSEDTLANTLRYARQRDEERLAEAATSLPGKKKTASKRTRAKKLKWRPGLAW